MEYCSLEDAFGAPNQESSRQERRKAKRCKGPAQAYIDPKGAYAPDPDRPSVVKQAPLPAMNPSTGLREHVPTEADVGTMEPFQPRNDGNIRSDLVRATLPTDIYGPTQLPSDAAPSFFGKDPSENFATFTHVIGDSKEYQLQPDFTDAFGQAGTLAGAGASAALPTPSVKDVWKPLTPSGARTAFFNGLPPPDYGSSSSIPRQGMKKEVTSYDVNLHSKIDKIFSRLDELETSRTNETGNAQTEVLLFIMSGIFVLFLTDLAVRKGAPM
jgi:hypothetical protein